MASFNEPPKDWSEVEASYQAQIKDLEQEQQTLKDAWSDIVRTNMANVEELKQHLEAVTGTRDEAQAQLDIVAQRHARRREAVESQITATKERIGDLLVERDRVQAQVFAHLARTKHLNR